MTTRLRRILLPAAAALLAGGAAFAVPALAHPHADGKTDRIMILHSDGADHGDRKAGAKSAPRQFHVMRFDGKDSPIHCDGDKTEVSTDEKDGRKTRFFVCTDDKLTGAQRAEKLEQALERIQANEHLSAEHKERVTGALRDAIGKMRETK
jgi:hypothetical protein